MSLFTQSFLFLMIIGCQEIFTFSYHNYFSVISLLITLVILISACIWGVILWWFILKTSPKDVPGPLEELFSGVKLETNSGRRYMVLFFVRRIGLVIAILIPFRFIQYAVYLGFNCFHSVVMVMKRPFKEKIETVIQTITDLSIVILVFIYSDINENNENDRFSVSKFNNSGDLLWYTIIFSNFLIFAILLLSFIHKLTQSLFSNRKNKNKVEVRLDKYLIIHLFYLILQN